MRKIFNKLYESKCLNKKESYKLFKEIISGKINEIQLSSVLTAMRVRGESIEEIIGAVNAFLEKKKFFLKPRYIFSDIVGTGGDTHNTINVSTASALVASACGFKIIKHCNQGVSSKSGSSDLLNNLNINLNASSKKSLETLDKLNICFLFAQKYHKGFKLAKNVRKILKTKTIFNLLGPFLNPATPPLIVIGVYKKELISSTIHILKQFEYKRCIVLHGNNTDEVTLNGKTYVSELLNGKIISYKLQAEDFGLKNYSRKMITESSKEENYRIICQTMKGNGDKFYEELIAVNVAVLMKVFGYEDLKENTQVALKKIRSGDVYKQIINISNMLKEDGYERHDT
ncbi:anthranilate phosphoribosyltransferase [Buchnera aphidicola (Muscaphis stroyani)]|uniref:Anthranilate phosphoribosyltransferase n=1 Tax=Buchnera aphidicola (Muscaphis stroyani) TaxID=1241869 RepID=A0A4D6YIT1_9GAMM|nr:anthranilate phosphoribosyltransferase [Buchnera aphidicola]QCI24355.1 anthranilate phosphoribosyltransferase [Buchnera aphidicola (Muscaphis stroyani)]